MAAPEQGSNNAADLPQREASDRRPPIDRPSTQPLPRPRRNYALAIIMALVVFALLIGMRVLWGGIGGRHTTPSVLQEETTPEVPAPSN